jgi:hypothetical protein
MDGSDERERKPTMTLQEVQTMIAVLQLKSSRPKPGFVLVDEDDVVLGTFMSEVDATEAMWAKQIELGRALRILRFDGGTVTWSSDEAKPAIARARDWCALMNEDGFPYPSKSIARSFGLAHQLRADLGTMTINNKTASVIRLSEPRPQGVDPIGLLINDDEDLARWDFLPQEKVTRLVSEQIDRAVADVVNDTVLGAGLKASDITTSRLDPPFARFAPRVTDVLIDFALQVVRACELARDSADLGTP